MKNNIDVLITKFEEACDNTTKVNGAINNMIKALEKYMKTLDKVKDIEELSKLKELGTEIENKIKNIEAYNTKEVTESFKKSFANLEKKIEADFKKQSIPVNIGNGIPKQVEKNLNKIVEQQEVVLDKLSKIENNKIINELEKQLNNANKKIEILQSEQVLKEKYYDSKLAELERKLFDLSERIDKSNDNYETIDIEDIPF